MTQDTRPQIDLFRPLRVDQAVSCVMTKLILDYTRREWGNEAVRQLLTDLRDSSGQLYDEKHLTNIQNWVPWEIKIALLDRLVAHYDDPAIPYKIGQAFPELHVTSLVRLLARSIMRPSRLTHELAGLITRYNAIASVRIEQQGSRTATLHYRLLPGYHLHHVDCELNKGLLSNLPRLFRMPPASVAYIITEDEQGIFCEYTLSWQVATSPRFLYWGVVLGIILGSIEGAILAGGFDLRSVVSLAVINAILGLVIGALLDRTYWTQQTLELITEQGEALQSYTQDLHRRSRDLTALSEIARRLTSILDPETLLGSIVDELEQLLSFHTAELYLYQAPFYELVAVRGLSEDAVRTAAESAPSRYPGMVITRKQPLLLGDVNANPQIASLVHLPTTAQTENGSIPDKTMQQIRSLLCVPIFYRERCLGVIGLGSKELNAFKADDLQLVTTFANQAAVAIENARLYKNSQRQLLEMEQLRQISLAISSTVDLNTVLGMIASTASRLVNADSGEIVFADTIMAEHDTHASDSLHSLAYQIITRGKPVVVSNLMTNPRLRNVQIEQDGPVAFAGLPLKAGDKTVGVLYVKSTKPRNFPPEEMNLLMLLSAQAAVALNNAQLYSSLNDEKGRVESLITTMSEALFTIDTNLQITGWNPAAETLTGWKANEVLGKRCADILQTPFCNDCPMRKLQHEGKLNTHFEYSIMTRSGGRVPVLAGYATTHAAGHDQYNSVAVLNNITQLKEVEQLKNTFVSMVSHEFRTPLTNIIAYADALHSLPVDEATTNEFTGVIYNEGKRLAGLVEDVLTLARIDMGNWEVKLVPTDVAEALHFCSTTFKPVLQKHSLTMLIAPEIPEMLLDRAKLIQVLTNLISNAIKYSPNGGQITVRSWIGAPAQPGEDVQSPDDANFIRLSSYLDRREADPARNPGSIAAPAPALDLPPLAKQMVGAAHSAEKIDLAAATWLYISVSDQGIGIPADAMDKLFKRFSRIDNATTRSVKGTGLGLAIVQALLEAHKGRIWVTSREHSGSTFTFGLPASDTRPAEQARQMNGHTPRALPAEQP